MPNCPGSTAMTPPSGCTGRTSVRSTARVFRGGDPHGRIAFTKDVVYLDGLMRAQLRLSVAVLALTVVGLAALPVTLTLVPATRTITVVGLPWTPAAWRIAVSKSGYTCVGASARCAISY